MKPATPYTPPATPYDGCALIDAIKRYQAAYYPECVSDFYYGEVIPRSDAKPRRITLCIRFSRTLCRFGRTWESVTRQPECELTFRAMGYNGVRLRAIRQLDADVRRKRRDQATLCRKIQTHLMHGASA